MQTTASMRWKSEQKGFSRCCQMTLLEVSLWILNKWPTRIILWSIYVCGPWVGYYKFSPFTPDLLYVKPVIAYCKYFVKNMRCMTHINTQQMLPSWCLALWSDLWPGPVPASTGPDWQTWPWRCGPPGFDGYRHSGYRWRCPNSRMPILDLAERERGR